MDFLACEPRPALDVSATSLLVLDEADRMLDMGFAHELRSAAACPPTLARPYIFCTALLPRHSEPPSSLPVGLKSSTALSCSGIIQRLPAPAGRQVQPPPPCAAPTCSPHHLHAATTPCAAPTTYMQPPTCSPLHAAPTPTCSPNHHRRLLPLSGCARCGAPWSPQTLLFTATWPPTVRRLASELLRPTATVSVAIGQGGPVGFGSKLKGQPGSKLGGGMLAANLRVRQVRLPPPHPTGLSVLRPPPNAHCCLALVSACRVLRAAAAGRLSTRWGRPMGRLRPTASSSRSLRRCSAARTR